MDETPPNLAESVFLFLEDGIFFKIIIVLILLLLSAFFSGSEVAFFSLIKKDFEHLDESKTNLIVKKLISRPRRLLATILITNNTINISIVLLIDSMHLFSSIENQTWLGFINSKFILEVGLVTFVILIFGEILPKVYANKNRLRFAQIMAIPTFIFDILFRFLSEPLHRGSGYLQKRLIKHEKSKISIGHLSQALELTSQEETSQQEKKMLKGIVSFGNTEIKQIMTPRIDILAINEDMSFSEVIECVLKSTFSRIPIYNESLDNITGILYSKDLLTHLDKQTLDWVKIKREVYFVPENKKIDDLLGEFKEKKIHLSIVVDEYGGTQGLVTLDDIIEEIVGDISDEFDQEDLGYTKIDDFNFVFEGKTMLRDFYKVIKIQDDEEQVFEDNKGESETLAGFALEISGNFPQKGDVISFNDYKFTVEVIDKKRIKQIKVSLPNV